MGGDRSGGDQADHGSPYRLHRHGHQRPRAEWAGCQEV